MLAQLVSHSGGTPQVLSSTPRGSEFQAEGKKKSPRWPRVPKHWLGDDPGRPEDPYMAQAGSSQGLRLPVSGRGQGSGIFSVGEADASS